MAWTVPWHLLGMVVAGDVGDITIYTRRDGRKVAFPRAPPLKPPSVLQQFHRDRFKEAIRLWKELPPADRQAWCLAVRRTSTACTPLGIWVCVALTGRQEMLEALERLSGITLTYPPTIP